MTGKRVKRVVLIDDRYSAGDQHAKEFAEKTHMLSPINMMKNASRKNNIK